MTILKNKLIYTVFRFFFQTLEHGNKECTKFSKRDNECTAINFQREKEIHEMFVKQYASPFLSNRLSGYTED